jgi:hypothetical protein
MGAYMMAMGMFDTFSSYDCVRTSSRELKDMEESFEQQFIIYMYIYN